MDEGDRSTIVHKECHQARGVSGKLGEARPPSAHHLQCQLSGDRKANKPKSLPSRSFYFSGVYILQIMLSPPLEDYHS